MKCLHIEQLGLKAFQISVITTSEDDCLSGQKRTAPPVTAVLAATAKVLEKELEAPREAMLSRHSVRTPLCTLDLHTLR